MYISFDKMYILFYNQDVHFKMYLLDVKKKGKNNEQHQTGKSTNNFYKLTNKNQK